MTIQGMIDFCLENNYQEISLTSHIKKYHNADLSNIRICTVRNDLHDLMIQAVFDEQNNDYIKEIYIDYEEDKQNPIVIVLQATEITENKLPYIELRSIDFDMNW